MSDYDGFEFAMGEIYGIRHWRVDRLGRLVAPFQSSYIWRPGENVARVCRECSKNGLQNVCACGFYAYTDLSRSGIHLYADGGSSLETVVGCIKAYGQVLVGEKGFRAQKAEIVAIQDVSPRRFRTEYDRSWKKRTSELLRRNYPSVFFQRSLKDLYAMVTPSTAHLPSPSDDEFWTMP